MQDNQKFAESNKSMFSVRFAFIDAHKQTNSFSKLEFTDFCTFQ
jgi:hypothetical protein